MQVVLGWIRNFDRSHSGWLEQNLETIESEMSSVQIGGGKEESITDHTAGWLDYRAKANRPFVTQRARPRQ